jgi:hypothetical protein
VVDLLATGHRRRLTDALEVGLARLDAVVRSHAPARATPPAAGVG